MSEETVVMDATKVGELPPTEAEVIDRKMQEAGVMIQLQRANVVKSQAYRRGRTAREQGFMRVSPYYEDAGRETAWFAGYDGDVEPTLDALLVPVLDGA